MTQLLNFLSSLEYGNVFLVVMRIGLFLSILGIFLLPKKRKTKLKNVVETQQKGVMESNNPIIRFAEGMMETKLFRGLKLKEKEKNGNESKDYKQTKELILKAGGLYNATPQAIQFFRIMIPVVLLVCLLSFYFINLTAEKSKTIKEYTTQVDTSVSLEDALGGFGIDVEEEKKEIILETVEMPTANPLVVMWLCIIPLTGYFVPDLILKNIAKKRVNLMQKEIPTFRTFAVSMLETKTYPVYNILKILVGSTTSLKEPIMECQNEYYVNAKAALTKLGSKVDDEEFRIVCNALAQAVDEDKETTLMFLRQQLSQYDTMKHLKEQEKIKKKPNLFVIVLGIPLVSILIIWFYPWFLDAMNVLGSIG